MQEVDLKTFATAIYPAYSKQASDDVFLGEPYFWKCEYGASAQMEYCIGRFPHLFAVVSFGSHPYAVIQLGRLYSEIYRNYPRPPSLQCCARNILTVHRETLSQYITFKRGGREESVLLSCTLYSSLTTVMSCVDLSMRIVTKSPKVGPLLIFSISLDLCI